MSEVSFHDFIACLKLWKKTLEFEETRIHRLYAVKNEIAQIEGKAYFKIGMAKEPLLQSFLLQKAQRFEIEINDEIKSFLHWLNQQKEIAKRYKKTFDLNFYLGFPTFQYLNAGKSQLGCLFYLEINSALFHQHDFNLASANESTQLAIENLEQFSEEVSFHVNSQIMEEHLGFDDDFLEKIYKIIKKASSNENLLKRFIAALTGDEIESDIATETLYKKLFEQLQSHLFQSDQKNTVSLYPHALFFSLNEPNPFVQIQKDYEDLLDEDMERNEDIPLPLYAFFNRYKSKRQTQEKLLTSVDHIECTQKQTTLLKNLLNLDYAIVNGPPGTGKTFIISTIIANKLVKHALQIDDDTDTKTEPIIITSTNNGAVDNALQHLELSPFLPCSIRMGSYIKLSEVTEKVLSDYAHDLLNIDEEQERQRFDKELDCLKKLYDQADQNNKIDSKLYQQARLVIHLWVVKNKNKVFDLINAIVNDLRNRKSLITLKKKDNLDLFFKIFPIVGTTLLSIRNLLPLQSEMIDLLLVDESSQCEPAYIIPALYRSRKAILIGDVHQLEPINSLYERDLNIIYYNNAFSFSKNYLSQYFNTLDQPRSAQHIAMDNTTKVFKLKEHFRCHKSIITICDELCNYDLKIKSKGNKTTSPFFGETALWYHNSEFAEQRYSSSWYNYQEAELIIKIVTILKNYGYQDSQIAILTPYKGQFNLIIKLLTMQKYNYQNAHLQEASVTQNILVGTIHRLQGGERDIILFSSVLKNKAPQFINSKLNLINVAVSRAKNYFVFVGNLENIRFGHYSKILYKHLKEKGKQLTLE